MNPVSLTHLLAQARAAEIARAAEHAAMFELSATPARRSRWAGLTHWSGRATRPTDRRRPPPLPPAPRPLLRLSAATHQGGSAMSRIQLALNVADIDAAVEFYSTLFATGRPSAAPATPTSPWPTRR